VPVKHERGDVVILPWDTSQQVIAAEALWSSFVGHYRHFHPQALRRQRGFDCGSGRCAGLLPRKPFFSDGVHSYKVGDITRIDCDGQQTCATGARFSQQGTGFSCTASTRECRYCRGGGCNAGYAFPFGNRLCIAR
jgi:hypothetical protein